MTDKTIPSVILDFIVKLRKADKRGLTIRDILVLYVVIEYPGISGMDVCHKLGILDRSSIASNLRRLERGGYIEDRRIEQKKAVPGLLHVLPGGLEFWNEIKP